MGGDVVGEAGEMGGELGFVRGARVGHCCEVIGEAGGVGRAMLSTVLVSMAVVADSECSSVSVVSRAGTIW